MAKLTKIGIGGFKSIKNLQELELRPTNILIGSNGSGKSDLIYFLNLLKAIADGKLQDHVARAADAATLLYYGAKITSAFGASVGFYVTPAHCSYFVLPAP